MKKKKRYNEEDYKKFGDQSNRILKALFKEKIYKSGWEIMELEDSFSMWIESIFFLKSYWHPNSMSLYVVFVFSAYYSSVSGMIPEYYIGDIILINNLPSLSAFREFKGIPFDNNIGVFNMEVKNQKKVISDICIRLNDLRNIPYSG